MKTLHDHLENFEANIDRQQQYSWRNCLLVHGINESKDKDTDELVLETFSAEMNIK